MLVPNTSGHSFRVLRPLPNARPFNEKASACSHVSASLANPAHKQNLGRQNDKKMELQAQPRHVSGDIL